jgi:hypothetical protein
VERREDAHQREEAAAADVPELHAREGRGATRLAPVGQHARARRVVDVVPGLEPIRPRLPVAGDGAIDEARVLLVQHGPAHAQLVHDAGAEALHQHVVASRQPLEGLAPLGRFEVQRQRALVAVEPVVERALVVAQGGHLADVVAAVGVLDLVHRGAEVGEHQRGVGAGQQTRQIQDLQSGEGKRVHGEGGVFRGR